MSSQIHLHSRQSLDSLSRFIHHCSQTKDLKSLNKTHAYLLTTGSLFYSPNIHTKLIDTYTICTDTTNPSQILSKFLTSVNKLNPLPFTLLISDFRRNNRSFLALKTLSFMHINRVYIDTYALCSALIACADSKFVEFGSQIHTHVEKSGFLCSVFVGSALIDFYSKLLLINDAQIVFDEMPVRNTVCVNALLSGYIDAKMWNEGVELIRKMSVLDLSSDNFTLSAALRGCAGLLAIQLGKQVHAKIIRTVYLEYDVFLQSSLIEMYGKCGLVEKAKQAFEMAGFELGREQNRDLVLWTSMLGVYGRNGHFIEVIKLYKDMIIAGVKPDGIAFLSIISACAHTGQIELGVEYFKSMVDDYQLNPKVEHYSSIVDLLCRGGEVEKAWDFVNKMSRKTNLNCSVSMWGALLSACYECGNVDLGILAANRAFELDPKNVGVYTLLSNMYVRHGMWDEIEPLREKMREKGLEKDVGCSWIEVTT